MFKKLNCILLFGVIFASFNLQAAENHLSLFAMYNQASVEFSYEGSSQYYSANSTSRSSMNYGFLLERSLQSLWSFESGLIYLERGFRTPVTPSSFTKREYDEYSWTGFYIPVEGRFRPTKVFTGFIGGYAFQSIGDMSYLSSSNQAPSKVEFSNQGFKTMDWGITYGAGINVQFNSQTEILIEVRFNEGLANLVDSNNQNWGDGSKAVNKETSISLGVLI